MLAPWSHVSDACSPPLTKTAQRFFVRPGCSGRQTSQAGTRSSCHASGHLRGRWLWKAARVTSRAQDLISGKCEREGGSCSRPSEVCFVLDWKVQVSFPALKVSLLSALRRPAAWWACLAWRVPLRSSRVLAGCPARLPCRGPAGLGELVHAVGCSGARAAWGAQGHRCQAVGRGVGEAHGGGAGSGLREAGPALSPSSAHSPSL